MLCTGLFLPLRFVSWHVRYFSVRVLERLNVRYCIKTGTEASTTVIPPRVMLSGKKEVKVTKGVGLCRVFRPGA